MASDEEEEEYLVHVDFDAVLENDIFNKPNLFFKVIGIDTETPVMQIEDQVFVGDYRDVPGTTVFFEDDPNPPQDDPVFGRNAERPLKYACKTRKSLVMRRVFVKKKDPKDICHDVQDETLTDEDELPEPEMFPPSPCSIHGDNSTYYSDESFKIAPELPKLQKYDIVDTKHKKRVGYVKRKSSHTKVKKTGSKGKSKGKEKGIDVGSYPAFSPEPVAGPSWLPDNVPEVNSEMLVEEHRPNVLKSTRDHKKNVKKERKREHKVAKTPRSIEEQKALLEKFVNSVDSAVEALLKDTGMTLTPDKMRVQRDPNFIPPEHRAVNNSGGEMGVESTRPHVNTEEMSRLTLKCSSDSQESESGGGEPDL